MASAEHRERFAFVTRWCPTVGQRATDDSVPEYEEIVVGSASMNVDAWRRAYAFGHVVAACHNLLLLDVVERWLRDQPAGLDVWFDALVDAVASAPAGAMLARWRRELDRFTTSILDGGPLLLAVEDVSSLDGTRRREPAEALALAGLSDLDRFYAEVAAVTARLLGPSEQLQEVFRFQRLATPGPGDGAREGRFEHDWTAYAAHPGPRPLMRR